MRHIILDRDGVLNWENPEGGYIRRPTDWRWLPGSLDALSTLSQLNVRISIATNQSGVGRGLMTRQDLEDVHRRMRDEAAEVGGRFDAIYACTHAPHENCDCRKPKPGMFLTAIDESGISAEDTLLIADATRDLEAAAAAHVKRWLVRTGKGAGTEARLKAQGRHALYDAVFDDLADAVANLVDRHAST